MKKIVILFALCFVGVTLWGQDYSKKERNYKPKNFEEALVQLDKIFPDSIKTGIRSFTEEEFVSNSHFGTGMWIRNEWLYKRFLGFNMGESDLRKELTSMGLLFNDDMSATILRSYYRKLQGQAINLDQQIDDIFQRNIDMGRLIKLKSDE